MLEKAKKQALKDMGVSEYIWATLKLKVSDLEEVNGVFVSVNLNESEVENAE